tara:strand:- start:3195 stop:3518 length:324 start_codon:yes stop_codon:yes gene_type:complete
MPRYRSIQTIQENIDTPRRYINVKYPEIPRDFSDIYVYTTQGDRYDLLSNIYYKDSSLWWIISTANYEGNYDSLIPPIGKQLRIPSPTRVSTIVGNYESLNELSRNI